MLKCLVIPDLTGIIEFEIERKKMQITYDIVKVRPPRLFKFKKWLTCCCFPNYLASENEYEKAMRKIDYEIDLQLQKNMVGSNTAFLSLDSFSTCH